jgi:hypothetical protein
MANTSPLPTSIQLSHHAQAPEFYSERQREVQTS